MNIHIFTTELCILFNITFFYIKLFLYSKESAMVKANPNVLGKNEHCSNAQRLHVPTDETTPFSRIDKRQDHPRSKQPTNQPTNQPNRQNQQGKDYKSIGENWSPI